MEMMKRDIGIICGFLTFILIVVVALVSPKDVQAAPPDQEMVRLMQEQNRILARIAESLERMSGQKPPLK